MHLAKSRCKVHRNVGKCRKSAFDCRFGMLSEDCAHTGTCLTMSNARNFFRQSKDNFRRPARDHADPKPVFKKSSFLAVLMIQER